LYKKNLKPCGAGGDTSTWLTPRLVSSPPSLKITMAKYGFSFSWQRLLGITSAKQHFAKETGVPTSKAGIERKLGSMLLNFIIRKK